MRVLLASLFAFAAISPAMGQEWQEKTYNLDGTNFTYKVLKSPEGKDFGYFTPASRWPSTADGVTVVYVCWENYSAALARVHKLVEDSVTDTWQRNSKLRFKGWMPCAPRSDGIRIFVHDDANDGPHTKGLGKDLNGKDRGMVLNFTYKNWQPFGNLEGDAAITSVAVHEFGHAIGFSHEQNRPDKPGECKMPAQGDSTGAVALTPYDKDSVMNYCSTNANNNGQLSKLDIVALQKAYGAN